jgi:hypothetical protein
MDYFAAIRELYLERARIDKTIARIESLSGGEQVERRGRKGMSEEERAKASDRMKRYWASRRNQRMKALP